MDNDKFSTGGFDEVPMGESQELWMWEHSIDKSTFRQLFTTKEDTLALLASLASLAASVKRLANASEKTTRSIKALASSSQRALDERKITNRALWQIVGELKQIKKR